MSRITLSGRNNDTIARTVFLDDVEIGVVQPSTQETGISDTWEGTDLEGRSHGDMWLSDWWAAESIERGLRLRNPCSTCGMYSIPGWIPNPDANLHTVCWAKVKGCPQCNPNNERRLPWLKPSERLLHVGDATTGSAAQHVAFNRKREEETYDAIRNRPL